MRRYLPVPVGIALILVTLLLQAACGARYHDDASRSASVLRVDNRGVDEVRVYLVRDRVRIKLGTVSPGTTRRFALSPAVVGDGHELRLRAEAVAARSTVTSEVFFLGDDGMVAWQVEAQLGMTSLMVY